MTAMHASDIRQRMQMMSILDRIYNPSPLYVERRWTGSNGLYYIAAHRFAYLHTNLKRIKWMEDLKIVKLFVFVEAHVNSTLHVNGRTVKLNAYVYEEVTKVIPADRIKVIGRYEENGYQRKGYPPLPMTYRFMKIKDPTPYYYTVPVAECNRYLFPSIH